MRRVSLVLALAGTLGLDAPGVGCGQTMPLNPMAFSVVDVPTMVLPDVLRGGSLPDGRSPDYKAKMAALNGRPAAAKAASFPYVPTAALRQQTVQGYLDRLKARNPAAAQALAAELGPGKRDYGQIYHDNTKDSGLRENDAADNMTALLLLGWMIVNDQRDGNAITVPMARGVRAQVAPGLAANGAAGTPATAARLGEELKLQMVVLQGGWVSAPKEGKQVEFRQGVAALFKNQYGCDLSQLKLTSQGFVRK